MADIKQCLYSLKDAAAVIIKDQGITEGHFELFIEFNVGVGNFGLSLESVNPSAVIGVQRIGISEVPNPTANSVDAAEINPKEKRKPVAKKFKNESN